jgi:hypothetical protein
VDFIRSLTNRISTTASIGIHRYSIPALIVAVLAFITLILVSDYPMKAVMITVEAILLICAVVSLIGMINCFRKDKDSPVYRIIGIGLTCLILGELLWVLHICIKGSERSGSFPLCDLPWLSFYSFLLYACLRVFEKADDFKDKKYLKITVSSCIVQLFIIGINVAFYIPGENLFFTIIYCIPSGFLSFYTVIYLLASFQKNEVLRGFRVYNITVFLILTIDNINYLLLIHGINSMEYIFKFCLALLLLVITPAVYCGVRNGRRKEDVV